VRDRAGRLWHHSYRYYQRLTTRQCHKLPVMHKRRTDLTPNERMKRILVLFGILDIVTLIWSYGHVTNLLSELSNFHWITLGNLLIYGSLVFSFYFLLKYSKIGLWLTYAQFPLRLSFMVFSFGFLLAATRLFDNEETSYKGLMWGVMGFEMVRLIITIQIHRTCYPRSKHSLT
jgi:hypothetical protein